MRLHSSITCRALTLAAATLLAACSLGGPEGLPLAESQKGRGRVAMRWLLDGGLLTAERCKAAGIDFMEVEVGALSGADSVAYTQVQCDLDRYSLTMTPLGSVKIVVAAVRKDPERGQVCLRYRGEALATAGTSFPATPTEVMLSAATGCKRAE